LQGFILTGFSLKNRKAIVQQKGGNMNERKRRAVWFFALAGICLTALSFQGCLPQKAEAQTRGPAVPAQTGGAPKVYMTAAINPAALGALYEALGRKLPGKVAVKISTGEPGGHHFLDPALIKDLVRSVKGTIVESNTAYGGRRASTAMHKQVAADHGFTAIAAVDILDENGSVSLPFSKGKNITEDFVGSHFGNYDSYLVLSHFKGHAMGGFGGAIKNISIGIASSEGKAWIHSGGKEQDPALGRKAGGLP
jgi:uncharacterized Fe-S center protein